MVQKINSHVPVTPGGYKKVNTERVIKEQGSNFNEIFKSELFKAGSELKFSAHAQQRIIQDGLNFEATQLEQIAKAVQKVFEKGGKESLVITDKAALVVSIKNNTVITVVDNKRIKENVFTNIDSAVIV